MFLWSELWKAPSLILRFTKQHVCVQNPSLQKIKSVIYPPNKVAGK